jgi:hypothetical protein
MMVQIWGFSDPFLARLSGYEGNHNSSHHYLYNLYKKFLRFRQDLERFLFGDKRAVGKEWG